MEDDVLHSAFSGTAAKDELEMEMLVIQDLNDEAYDVGRVRGGIGDIYERELSGSG